MRSGPPPDEVPTVEQVSQRTMSPFCPGLTLEECPSDQATQLRDRIEEMVQKGATNREIDEWMVSNYGEVVLARPDHPLAWAAPVAAAVLGLIALVVLGRRRLVQESRANHPVELSEQERARVSEDLDRFRAGLE
ncbi:MAG: cytochrome c-type biogenesis protein CcmH [Actinomycetota bacterium]|nr:cytochrome c-type biogenesis protein CcmH [Actinomycetota bacterium]